MKEDHLRTDRARREIATAGLDLAVCQLSSHVLMLTGYAPVLGQSYVVFPANAEPALVVPSSEEPFAREGWCADVRTYHAESSAEFKGVLGAVGPVLQAVIAERGLEAASLGYEGTSDLVPASYAQVGFPSAGLLGMLGEAFPRAQLVDVAPVLRVLQSTMTPRETQHLGTAIAVAALGFEAGRDQVRIGRNESSVAAATESAIQAAGRKKGAERVLAFAHVMSGARSALAFHPFNLTNDRTIQAGDPVLVQLEVYADGFWSSVTRTYFAGDPGAEGRRIYESCARAHDEAVQAIHNGVAASAIDQIARDCLDRDGFGACFRHGLGHGVGFQAISPFCPPRLGPGSTDTLLTDDVFTVEPGVYVHGWGGIRINDTIQCRPRGADILTRSIPCDLKDAIVMQRARA
ncbi:MAG: M24 family metallopeptidase [Chloroflexota bacterium]